MQDPDVEVRDATVVAYFPAGIDAAYLTPSEARAWAGALTRAAVAAELVAEAMQAGTMATAIPIGRHARTIVAR